MKKNSCNITLVLNIVFALALTFFNNVCAYDSDPLQDFCVATDRLEKKGVYVNGKFCKDPKNVTADDFFYPCIDISTNVRSKLWRYKGTALDAKTFPGINTLGVSILYIEHELKGIAPPRIHPRASEILLLLKGVLKVGFVTSNLDGNRLFEKTLHAGDVFVIPIGLAHFYKNVGDTKAIAFNIFGSQNPGIIVVPEALFDSRPRINTDILAKSFQVKEDVIEYLQSIKWEL